MQIDTKRFGTISVGDDELFSVPSGIPGFPTVRRAALLGAAPAATATATDIGDGTGAATGPETGEHSMFWLQDADDGDLAFLCLVPWDVFPAYDLEIDEHELGIDDHQDVRVLNLLTVRRSEVGASLTANLRAPIIVDVRRRQLFQVILGDSRWTVDQPVAASTTSGAR